MKPDKIPETPMASLARRVRFNTIDVKSKKGVVIAFKIDNSEEKFLEDFCKKFGLNISEAGRFCIDIIRSMDEGGLLQEFVTEFSKYKQEMKVR
jgi:hypothetical protein